MEDAQVHRRRSRHKPVATATPASVRLARLIRAPMPAQAATSGDAANVAIVIEARGLRVTIGREADFGLVAMVVAIIGAGGGR